MLILSRHPGDSIFIGNDIVVKVIRLSGENRETSHFGNVALH